MADLRNRHKNKDKLTSSSKIKQEKQSGGGDRVPPPASKISSLRIISRLSVTFSLLIIVYFYTKDQTINSFAKQTEVIPGKGQIVECSAKYLEEVKQFDGCHPIKCKRFVSDKVISSYEANELLEIAKKGLKLGGSYGGASILDLHSGALSMNEKFVNIYEIDKGKNIFQESDFTVYRIVKEKVRFAVAHTFNLDPDSIYLTHPTFFSQMTSKEAKTVHDEYWHPHVDKETYMTLHYSTLLYLNDYSTDFTGGRFIFVDEKSNRTLEPKLGRLVMFTSGSENVHYVEKVQSGTRYALSIFFTCNKKYAIEDPSMSKYNIQHS